MTTTTDTLTRTDNPCPICERAGGDHAPWCDLELEVQDCDGRTCPGCGGRRFRDEPEHGHSFYSCARCGCLISDSCYLGESYAVVAPRFYDGPDPDPSLWRGFDFRCLGSKGITRRHGFYYPATGELLQVG